MDEVQADRIEPEPNEDAQEAVVRERLTADEGGEQTADPTADDVIVEG